LYEQQEGKTILPSFICKDIEWMRLLQSTKSNPIETFKQALQRFRRQLKKPEIQALELDFFINRFKNDYKLKNPNKLSLFVDKWVLRCTINAVVI
jgi:hypothetical protein